MELSRKRFVAAAALGFTAPLAGSIAAASAEAQESPLHFHVLTEHEYDRNAMLAALGAQKRHKQVYLSISPLLLAGNASLYVHMQNALNAFEFSFGEGPGTLGTLGIVSGPSTVYGLNDAMWEKYGFGAAMGLAPTNVYYKARHLAANGSADDPSAVYQDWSAQAVMHRGGSFMLCHNAMTFVAQLFAPHKGMTTEATLAEFERNVQPGFVVVPAAIGAMQLALEHGWLPYEVI